MTGWKHVNQTQISTTYLILETSDTGEEWRVCARSPDRGNCVLFKSAAGSGDRSTEAHNVYDSIVRWSLYNA